jgi:hypothetical protein
MGEGQLRPIDIILAFAPARREAIDELFVKHERHTYRTFEKHAHKQGFAYEEARLYHDVRRSKALRGDIYVLIADIEIALHRLVRGALANEFGGDESQWWRQGVPQGVRKACVQAREDDPDPVQDPYCYTTFIHLNEIIDANWSLFRPILPDKLIKDRKTLLRWLRQLNHVRNAIMHPVKEKPWRATDLDALKTMHDLVQAIASKT